jgi:hypothetical protein
MFQIIFKQFNQWIKTLKLKLKKHWNTKTIVYYNFLILKVHRFKNTVNLHISLSLKSTFFFIKSKYIKLNSLKNDNKPH